MRLTSTLARRIELLVLDVDGVLTDGSLWFGASGEQFKRFHARDGHGVKLLQQAGVTVAVISGRRSRAVAARCRELGIAHVFQGAANKSAVFDRLLTKLQLTADRAACIGDDTPDIPLMLRVAFAVAVRDAHPLACAAADRITTLPGGTGAVREVCDWLLHARGAAARTAS
ncbi:MAG: HAD-IIIA family hydrolase [Nevskiaceae bacterium]|jgi:3-deoxy-D-manno-octulosonate 8-phosphate phosphatase (KDO 8-P phosphatase)|nr:HAD-IIIA family hydrolase [Nevskiaceae bacterium]